MLVGQAAAGLLVVGIALTIAACGGLGPRGPLDSLTARQRAALHAGPAEPVKVAVIDGGIATTHPALRDKVVDRWRAPGLASEPSPHATQLAGIVAGQATEAYSGGLAPAAVLVDVQALDAQGLGTAEDLAAALRFAAGTGAEIVLTSLSLGVDDPRVRAAVAALVERGAVVVAASGNGFTDAPAYPAAYPGVMAVAALDRRGHRLQLSGWENADVAAPGEALWAPVPGDGYAEVTGTSAAAAVAAGLVAACADHQPLTGQQIRALWTDGRVTDAGRARPRLTCPGNDDEGGR